MGNNHISDADVNKLCDLMAGEKDGSNKWLNKTFAEIMEKYPELKNTIDAYVKAVNKSLPLAQPMQPNQITLDKHSINHIKALAQNDTQYFSETVTKELLGTQTADKEIKYYCGVKRPAFTPNTQR